MNLSALQAISDDEQKASWQFLLLMIARQQVTS